MPNTSFFFAQYVLGSAQIMLQQATLLQISGKPHKLKHLLISAAAILSISALTQRFAPFLSAASMYIALVLFILSYRIIFKQPLKQSLFMGLGQMLYVQFIDNLGQFNAYILKINQIETYSITGLILTRLIVIVELLIIYLVVRRKKAHIAVDFKEKWHRLMLIYLTFIVLLSMPIIIHNQQKQIIISSYELYYTAAFLLFIIISTIYIRSLIKISDIKNQLETQQLYIETLDTYTSRLRTFKHDYDNTINTIVGLIHAEDIDGLKQFHKELELELIQANNLGQLNTQLKNIPLLGGIVMSFITAAELHGIEFRMSMPKPVKLEYCSSLDFSRIIGILLDNAFEAAVQNERKYIEFSSLQTRGIIKIIIKNAYNKPVDIDRIFKKGYTTKQEHSGIGLYEVQEIVKKYRNKNKSMSIEAEYEDRMLMMVLTL